MATDKSDNLNPISDLLHGHSFPALAGALRAQTKSIIVDWEKAVRKVLPTERKVNESQLRDHLPQILALLADALAEDDPAETKRLMSSPSQHGEVRVKQNYDVQGFILEYRLLRRIALEQIESKLGRRLQIAEDLALNMGIDDLLQRGVVTFVLRQEERFRAAAESEARYLSFLSYDLKNNLNGVIMSLEVLRRRLKQMPDFADGAEDLEAAQHSIFDTVDGMNRLLQAERIRKGAEPHLTTVDLHALVTDVARQCASQATRKGLLLAVEIEPGAKVQTDREWVALVLQNLIGNAIKYSDKGTVRLARQSRRDRRGSWQVLLVSDEGPGIAPENLERLFVAFTRGPDERQDGVGLGLAVALQAAKQLGGELNVESKVGAGSTFMLALPDDSKG